MNHKSKEFRTLKATWYKKLAASGFHDAEQPDENLKLWASYFSIRYKGGRFEAKQQYFILASQFLHDYAFESEHDRVIWEMHAAGFSTQEISKSLGPDGKNSSKSYVSATIRRIRKEMISK